jgi:hypothetical protein
MRKLFLVLMATCLCAFAAGCGDEPPVVDGPSLELRIVDSVDTNSSCNADENLLSAYCFSDAGRSVSSSGPALQADEGRIIASCLTGGPHLRLFCVKK